MNKWKFSILKGMFSSLGLLIADVLVVSTYTRGNNMKDTNLLRRHLSTLTFHIFDSSSGGWKNGSTEKIFERRDKHYIFWDAEKYNLGPTKKRSDEWFFWNYMPSIIIL